jgi:hypothetical protein
LGCFGTNRKILGAIWDGGILHSISSIGGGSSNGVGLFLAESVCGGGAISTRHKSRVEEGDVGINRALCKVLMLRRRAKVALWGLTSAVETQAQLPK